MPARPSQAPEFLLPALAHEVGNLLAAIRLSAHLLAKTLDPEERERGASEIEQLAAQAGELLAQVRPLLTDPKRRRARVRVAEVLEALARSFAEPELAEGHLVVGGAPRGIADVRVDPDALHHVLLVLVRAALHAMDPGPRVKVTAAQRGSRVVFEIVDRGLPYEELTPIECAPPVGRELAIAITNAVVRRDRGRVELETTRRGTVVRVVVPAVRS